MLTESILTNQLHDQAICTTCKSTPGSAALDQKTGDDYAKLLQQVYEHQTVKDKQ